MNRDELDAFFTRADDVLTDWAGSADSMNTAASGTLAPLSPRTPAYEGYFPSMYYATIVQHPRPFLVNINVA